VQAHSFTQPRPIAGIDFPGLFNPIALATDGDHVYVLDQGDTCLARVPPGASDCSQNSWIVYNYDAYWRVRRYGLLGGLSDTTSFTDTTLVTVEGIAADEQGRVYVAGKTLVYLIDPTTERNYTRTTQYRVNRYVRGPRYPGVVPADRNMPGSDWHRDTTWVVEEGSGLGTMVDPRGMVASSALGPALYATDFGKSVAQKISTSLPSTGFYALDGSESGLVFDGPTDIAVDLQGFVYVLDPGTRRVLRFKPDASYLQTVNYRGQEGDTLVAPVTTAVNDSMVYVGDATGKVIRYRRRS
jgi:hypothetical protein